MSWRIGQGYDVHRFTQGDHILLGGVKIPHTQGILAHSDGDVLLHALCDALLGALALGDIGQHFPDTDAKYAQADSRQLLKQVLSLVTEKGYALVNIDTTILAQAPKLMPFKNTIQAQVAADLGLEPDQVSIKATTLEGLGALGRQEGIGVQAVVLLKKVIDVLYSSQ